MHARLWRACVASVAVAAFASRLPLSPDSHAARLTAARNGTQAVGATIHRARAGRPTDASVIGHQTACVDSSQHISVLATFGHLVGRSFNCVELFNDASPDWNGWDHPWFAGHTYTDFQWARWATARGTHRQLVITQDLMPSSLQNSDWLRLGSEGRYERYARTLARTLIHDGLSHSVIRLAHEANGTWYPDSIPGTPRGDRLWVMFWRKTVQAMRSVPGAHFKFDWTISAIYRDVPLSSFYPGDDVVDIIGIDLYDSLVPEMTNRWAILAARANSMDSLSRFAAAHHKPVSIPEWGIGPAQQPGAMQAGDDPAYVNGLSAAVRTDHVAYQSYFFADAQLIQFINSPRSIAAYRKDFRTAGNSIGTHQRSSATLPRIALVAPKITAGPANGSTVAGPNATFAFSKPNVKNVTCSLDGAYRPCAGPTFDQLKHLRPGYHIWIVRLSDPNADVALNGRTFVVAPPGPNQVLGGLLP